MKNQTSEREVKIEKAHYRAIGYISVVTSKPINIKDTIGTNSKDKNSN